MCIILQFTKQNKKHCIIRIFTPLNLNFNFSTSWLIIFETLNDKSCFVFDQWESDCWLCHPNQGGYAHGVQTMTRTLVDEMLQILQREMRPCYNLWWQEMTHLGNTHTPPSCSLWLLSLLDFCVCDQCC